MIIIGKTNDSLTSLTHKQHRCKQSFDSNCVGANDNIPLWKFLNGNKVSSQTSFGTVFKVFVVRQDPTGIKSFANLMELLKVFILKVLKCITM